MNVSGEHSDEFIAVHIASLIHKLKEKQPLTAGEQEYLLQWRQADDANEGLFEAVQHRAALAAEVQQLQQYNTDAAWKQLSAGLSLQKQAPQQNSVLRRRWAVAAAAVLLLLAGSVWLVLRPRTVAVNMAAISRYRNDVAPGTNKAILTLADGTTIMLDSSHSGQLTQQGGVTVTQQSGHLVYKAEGKDTAAVYHTMTTPRGGQFMVLLPDNTKVWLNAVSSIRFPTVFNGSERLVELSGEAYFEITPQAAQPFVVKMNDTKVRVLGTQFNSMAYAGDAVSRTTLVDGLVQVETKLAKLVVHPGEQAVAGESLRLDTHPDIEEVLAWKNGRFQFGENTSISMLMRQIANWYDVEVVYHGTVKNHIGGSVPRTATLAHLLKVLEATGVVHFTLEGRKVDVYPSE